MASKNTRLAMERQFAGLMARNQRQMEAINRLLQANTAMSAALFEIADGELGEDSARFRARRALDEVSALLPDHINGKAEDQTE